MRVAGVLPVCLIVEDEYLIALQVESEINALGLASAGPYPAQADALLWLGQNQPDIAVIDCQLRDGICSDLARELTRRRIPYLVHSAHPPYAAGLDAFQPSAWIAKPSSEGEIGQKIVNVLAAPTGTA